MRIGFDVDGVLYNFTKAYHLWLNQSKGMSLDIDVEAQTWDWFTEWETKEEFVQNLHDSVDAGFMYWQGELYEPTIRQNLLDLRAAGHTVHVVTARTFGVLRCSREATEFFFKENDLVYDELLISNNKAEIHTDLFIEDNLFNYDVLDAAGVTSYLLNRPYNVEIDNRRRVDSVDQFTQLILEERWSSLGSVYVA